MKTLELTGAALDWAVAKAEGKQINNFGKYAVVIEHNEKELIYKPSQWWALGGEIIERENISIMRVDGGWENDANGYTTDKRIIDWVAEIGLQSEYAIFDDETTAYWIEAREAMHGNTPLIAAMRCYVASKLGDEIDVPYDLR